jgi:hypothetical protein
MVALVRVFGRAGVFAQAVALSANGRHGGIRHDADCRLDHDHHRRPRGPAERDYQQT